MNGAARPIRFRQISARRATLTLAVGVMLGTQGALGTSGAEEARLPGGTPIGVTAEIMPADGKGPDEPIGSPKVVGRASVGQGQSAAPVRLIYVVDGSNSTLVAAGGDCGPDQNTGDPDSAEDEIIDCEIAAAARLNEVAAAPESVVAEVAMVVFAGEAVVAEPVPGGGGPFVHPGADANRNGVPDVVEVLQSIQVAHFPPGGAQVGASGISQFSSRPITRQGTNFGDAIRKALDVAGSAFGRRTLVVFLSDGEANAGNHVRDVLSGASAVFHTFAVGGASSCGADPSGRGSLDDIAQLTGGACTEVKDPTNLPEVVPSVLARLDSLEIRVDGGASRRFSGTEVSAALPVRGPATVTYETNLAQSAREVCVTARGADSGGAGTVTTCPLGGVDAGSGGSASDKEEASPRSVAGTMPSLYGDDSAPRSIAIPAIDVSADIVPLGLRADGTLQVPGAFQQAGWYQHGARPGHPGPAVVVGHVDSFTGPAVFNRLDSLQPGDEVGVVYQDGSVTRFVVDRLEQHPKRGFPTEAVYGATTGPTLRLITCGGPFDPVTGSYQDNVVVYASLISEKA